MTRAETYYRLKRATHFLNQAADIIYPEFPCGVYGHPSGTVSLVASQEVDYFVREAVLSMGCLSLGVEAENQSGFPNSEIIFPA